MNVHTSHWQPNMYTFAFHSKSLWYDSCTIQLTNVRLDQACLNCLSHDFNAVSQSINHFVCTCTTHDMWKKYTILISLYTYINIYILFMKYNFTKETNYRCKPYQVLIYLLLRIYTPITIYVTAYMYVVVCLKRRKS